MESQKPAIPPRRLATILHHGSYLLLLTVSFGLALLSTRYVLQERVFHEEAIRHWKAWIVAIALAGTVTAGIAGVARALSWIRGGWSDCSGLPFRLFFYAYTFGAATELIFLQPFHRASFATLSAATAGGAGLATLLEKWLRSCLRNKACRRADLVLLNLCLTVVGAELGLRALAKFCPMALLAQDDIEAVERIRSFRYPAGRLRYGFPCNSSGCYDEEPGIRDTEDRLVVSISDSFGAGVVPHAFHFTTVCERASSRTKVYNMGILALGPTDYLHLVKTEARDLRPDVLVVTLFVGNDIAGRSLASSLRYWFDRGNLLIYLLPKRLLGLAAETGLKKGPGDDLSLTMPMAAEDGGPCDEREIVKRIPWLLDPLKEPPCLSRERFLSIERERALRTCGASTARFEELFEVLREIREAAGTTPLLFLIIPDEFQVEDDLWEDVTAAFPGRTLDRDQPQRLIGRWLAREGLPFVDLLPELRSVTPLSDGRRHCYLRHDTHFNVRGNEVAGRALARGLEKILR